MSLFDRAPVLGVIASSRGKASRWALYVLAAATAAPLSAAEFQESYNVSVTADPPSEYRYECRMERGELTARIVAENAAVYPESVARTDDGWLIYERFDRQVVELDDGLSELRRWGRSGEGPMEYNSVAAMVRTGPGQVVVFDDSPPSMLVFGEDEEEHRLSVVPHHAVLDQGRLMMADRAGDVFEVAPESGETRLVHRREDWEIPAPTGEGQPPNARLKPGGYVGFLGVSAVWGSSPSPKALFQRCVHEDLRAVHTTAPTINLGPPLGVQRYSVITMQDFAALPSGGFVALGGLRVDDDHHRSIERYGGDGDLASAWRLVGFPSIEGAFDDRNPTRLLVWAPEAMDGVALIEYAEGLPATR